MNQQATNHSWPIGMPVLLLLVPACFPTASVLAAQKSRMLAADRKSDYGERAAT